MLTKTTKTSTSHGATCRLSFQSAPQSHGTVQANPLLLAPDFLELIRLDDLPLLTNPNAGNVFATAHGAVCAIPEIGLFLFHALILVRPHTSPNQLAGTNVHWTVQHYNAQGWLQATAHVHVTPIGHMLLGAGAHRTLLYWLEDARANVPNSKVKVVANKYRKCFLPWDGDEHSWVVGLLN
ncbi:hypothetical protein CYLTODRAFT_479577 [Cylindrobasidium torrendii FP15055 ss-10]|uniref:Uncharacterized protein n=1 Tax=Cylindrobasidium torrendii FP15055 ss-10 TaxID=1314674 RepID=A0A0D7ATA0_9AGAR|nr:hypothetical protein CYLTODRAFT_479577 [Cylindrobasidium torrendii FP15055 ss-10]